MGRGRGSPEWIQGQYRAIVELPQLELTHRCGGPRAMDLAVYQEAAAAFAAVVLEAHRHFSGADQLFVELI